MIINKNKINPPPKFTADLDNKTPSTNKAYYLNIKALYIPHNHTTQSSTGQYIKSRHVTVDAMTWQVLNKTGHYLHATHGEMAATSAVLAPGIPTVEPAITCNPIHLIRHNYYGHKTALLIK